MSDLRGASWPFRIVGGKVRHSKLDMNIGDVEIVEEMVVRNLLTSVTERLGLITSGGNVITLVFDNFNDRFVDVIKTFLIAAILKDVPLVEVTGIEFPRKNDVVHVDIKYRIKESQEEFEVLFNSSGEVGA